MPAGTVKVEAGAFAIPNVAKRPSDGIIEFQLSGPVAALAEIADADPLNALSSATCRRTTSAARLTPRCRCASRCATRSTEADVDWKVVAKTKDAASKAPIEGRRAEQCRCRPDRRRPTTSRSMARPRSTASPPTSACRCRSTAPPGGEAGRAPGPPGARRCRRASGSASALEDVLSGTVTATGDRRRCRRPALRPRPAAGPRRAARASAGRRASACRRRCPSTRDDRRRPVGRQPRAQGRRFRLLRLGQARLRRSICMSADIDNLSLHKGDSISLQADARQAPATASRRAAPPSTCAG